MNTMWRWTECYKGNDYDWLYDQIHGTADQIAIDCSRCITDEEIPEIIQNLHDLESMLMLLQKI